MASAKVIPHWLKSAHVTGLDQLGVQVVSIALYGDLLPGLTNVTDRIRYYSFYPWILHRYARDVGVIGETAWQEHLRRAEFLLALVGHAHHRENDQGGEAIVGADQAKKALAEIEARPTKAWRISEWSAVAKAGSDGSYFKNKNGGFGQYYRGQLASLGLISVSDDPLGIKLEKGLGTEIARICDSQRGRSTFWKAVLQDKFTLEQLQEWGDCLCPCAVAHHEKEREFLINMLFGWDAKESQSSSSRARTLTLLLAVLHQGRELDDPVTHFRELAYYGHDASGKRFRPPAHLADVLEKWTIYESCEFVHYALEMAFDAVLHHLSDVDVEESDVNRFIGMTANSALRMESADLNLGTRKGYWCERSLGDIVSEARKRQKPLANWDDDPWAEDNLIFGIEDKAPLRRLACAFACLIAIHARARVASQSFGVFSTVSQNWFSRHRVTALTVDKCLSEGLNKNAAAVLVELLNDYVVGQHLRVAMRKLRYDTQSTFKLAIEDRRFVWLENFEPTRTNPRLRQAFRFLRDLGLCSGESGDWKLSQDGREQLRRTNGH